MYKGSLQKVYDSLVMPKYPEIQQIVVSEDGYNGYYVYVGINYDDLFELSKDRTDEEIKKLIRELSKFVLPPNMEGISISQIYWIDPEFNP
jgi:hypothetical protein